MDEREVMFMVEDKEIMRNGLYVIVGPGNVISRMMATSYDPKNNSVTWVAPTASRFSSDGRGLMAAIQSADLFRAPFNTSKPYLQVHGGEIDFDLEYKPTPDQWEILKEWDQNLERAGIGGQTSEFSLDDVKRAKKV